jgi:hypothetical protein
LSKTSTVGPTPRGRRKKKKKGGKEAYGQGTHSPRPMEAHGEENGEMAPVRRGKGKGREGGGQGGRGGGKGRKVVDTEVDE